MHFPHKLWNGTFMGPVRSPSLEADIGANSETKRAALEANKATSEGATYTNSKADTTHMVRHKKPDANNGGKSKTPGI